LPESGKNIKPGQERIHVLSLSGQAQGRHRIAEKKDRTVSLTLSKAFRFTSKLNIIRNSL